MKVSIVTITYNSAKTLEDTIRSVRSQDYKDLEYCVWDGISKDGTLEILKRHEDVIDVMRSDKDIGLYDAINKGISLCSGEVIGLLHSDDVFASDDVVSSVARLFERDPELSAVYGNITYFKDDINEKPKRRWKSRAYYDGFFEDGEIPPHPSLFVRREVYEKYGTYFPKFKISSDYELMLRLFKCQGLRTAYIDKDIVRMRLGGESTKSWKNILIGNREVLKAWKMNNLTPPLKFYIARPVKKIKQLF